MPKLTEGLALFAKGALKGKIAADAEREKHAAAKDLIREQRVQQGLNTWNTYEAQAAKQKEMMIFEEDLKRESSSMKSATALDDETMEAWENDERVLRSKNFSDEQINYMLSKKHYGVAPPKMQASKSSGTMGATASPTVSSLTGKSLSEDPYYVEQPTGMAGLLTEDKTYIRSIQESIQTESRTTNALSRVSINASSGSSYEDYRKNDYINEDTVGILPLAKKSIRQVGAPITDSLFAGSTKDKETLRKASVVSQTLQSLLGQAQLISEGKNTRMSDQDAQRAASFIGWVEGEDAFADPYDVYVRLTEMAKLSEKSKYAKKRLMETNNVQAYNDLAFHKEWESKFDISQSNAFKRKITEEEIFSTIDRLREDGVNMDYDKFIREFGIIPSIDIVR